MRSDNWACLVETTTMSFDLHDIRGYTEYNNNNHNTV